MAETRVTVLAIGQGSASLIEVWEGDSYEKRSNLFVALMDCGSDDSKERQNVIASISTIQEAMIRRTGDETQPYLDVLIISHQDKDHWDKLNILFEKVNGKRIINELFNNVETCIQKPALINMLFDKMSDITVLAGQEQYSNIKSICDIVLYKGSQHLQIEGQELYTNITYSYTYFFEFKTYTVQFETDDPYLEISITYNDNKDKNKNNYKWSFTKDNISEEYRYDYNEKEQLYELKGPCPNRAIPENCSWERIFKETMDHFFCRTQIYLSSDIIMAIFSRYQEFLENFTIKFVQETIANNQNLQCYIGQTFIGGQENIYSRSFENMRDRIKAVTNSRIEQLIRNQNRKEILMHRELGMKCTVLCCNTLSNCNFRPGGSGRSLEHNASSAVVQWEINGDKVLYPGDATVHTMYYMLMNNLTSTSQNCILLAPHHGSGTTSGIADKNGPGDSWEVLEGFLKNIHPRGIFISAGLNNRHGHPNLSFVLKAVGALFTQKTDLHYIYYNTQLSGNTERDYQMTNAIIPLYTTVSYNKDEQIEYMSYSFSPHLNNKDKQCEEELLDQAEAAITVEQAVPFGEEQPERSIRASVIDLNQVNFLEDRFERR
jgi:beta-lactamase superfamily II metal-dependent hydrolase